MLKRKFSFISAALMLVFVDSAGATGPAPSVGQVSVSGNGTNQVTSSSSATSYVQGAGSSISRAANTQSAESYIGAAEALNKAQAGIPLTCGEAPNLLWWMVRRPRGVLLPTE